MDHLLPSGKAITGTMLWYYAICKREVWLLAHCITPDEEHQSLEIGRAVHENFYAEMKKEIEAEGMKIDVVSSKEGMIYEVKTSSKFVEATKLQLGYYLYRLERMRIKMDGVIVVPRERRRIRVTLDDQLREKVLKAIKEIRDICSSQTPPQPVKIPFCRRCAYRDFCWADAD